MGDDADEIAIGLAKHFKRQGWMRTITGSVGAVVISVATTVWAARGAVDELKQQIALQAVDLKYLREHVDGIQQQSIKATDKADQAINMIYAAKGGYPPPGKTQ